MDSERRGVMGWRSMSRVVEGWDGSDILHLISPHLMLTCFVYYHVLS